MLFCNVNMYQAPATAIFPQLIEGAGDISRGFSLQEAINGPISIGKGLYKKPITGKGKSLGENQGIDFGAESAYDYAIMTTLTSCAPIIVYDSDTRGFSGGNVWVFHAFGGDIPDNSMLFKIDNPAEKFIVYTVRAYGSDYDKYIDKILCHGYQSKNLCIVSGYPNNICVGRDGGVSFY